MGVTDVPQWLPSAFVRSVLAVGATAPREEIEETCSRLLARWQEPDRHFHNLKHLVDVLARVDELAEETHHPDVVRLATWYHGAVFSSTPSKAYSRSGGEDEVASAELATTELAALGVPEKVTARVAYLILNLKRHDADPRDIDALALCDADLAVLAADPQHYRSYRKAVREEYAHLPLRHYLEARMAIVTKLLARRQIFLSPLGEQWEDSARENLHAELERLRGELAVLGTPAPGDSVTEAEAAHGLVAAEAGPGKRVTAEAHPLVVRPHDLGPLSAATPASTAGRGPEAAPAAGTPVPGAGAAVVPARVVPSAVTPARAATPAETGRTPAEPVSSLEAMPDDLDQLAPRQLDDAPAARRAVAQSSRDRIEEAVRQARAERERSQRDRLAGMRAEREEAQAAFRERRQARSAPSPDTAEPDGDRPAAPPVAVPPQHGMEREPELLEPRRKRDKRPR
ncbi:hypothetical protein [Georgenia thermotolerans]|uniref:Metal-dependent phosphohydrolase n=1 Tax=Georgenia thermotolerans TaxID=527326 RepID=A0A7J5UNC4_9MICO|nr:hypothetical protein [Georgenia thermotolerans]KAE8763885.1 hypothetical protein GB883_11820 [Georgenia thermotolerans]